MTPSRDAELLEYAPHVAAPAISSATLRLGVLIVLALGLRVMQAARLECISRDGVGFVRFAKELASDPRFYLKAELSQPGYSAVLLATRRAIGPWLSSDPVLAWERSGQLLDV